MARAAGIEPVAAAPTEAQDLLVARRVAQSGSEQTRHDRQAEPTDAVSPVLTGVHGRTLDDQWAILDSNQ